MTIKPPFSHRLRTGHLSANRPTEFDLQPDDATRAKIAKALDIVGLPAARMTGRITLLRNDSWELTARLTGRVIQSCVVTLVPVASKIDEEVRRVYSPHMTPPEEEEVEMPDDALEPLGQFIDPAEVMMEELALAMPQYPRAPGAGMPDAATEEDSESGDTRKPFAGLGDLLKNRH